MTDRELMQQALEALETADESAFWIKQESIVKALRDRLAQPEQDAVLAEREACATMLDENAMACENPIYRSLLQANAHAIREMGKR